MSQENRALRGLTLNHIDAGFVLGTTSTYTTAAATSCSIGGKFAVSLGAQTNTASPTTDARTAAAFAALTDNKACSLVWGVNAAGAIQLCQGPIVDTEVGITTTAGAFRDVPPFPALPDDFCAIAYGLVRTAPSAGDFTPGTSNWTATGITASVHVDVSQLPDRPQTA